MYNVGIVLAVLVEIALEGVSGKTEALEVWRQRRAGVDLLMLCAYSWLQAGTEEYRIERSASGYWSIFVKQCHTCGFGQE